MYTKTTLSTIDGLWKKKRSKDTRRVQLKLAEQNLMIFTVQIKKF